MLLGWLAACTLTLVDNPPETDIPFSSDTDLDSDTDLTAVPSEWPFRGNFNQIELGYDHGCTWSTDVGDFRCFGSNNAAYPPLSEQKSLPARTIAVGIDITCIVDTDNHVNCWAIDEVFARTVEASLAETGQKVMDMALGDDLFCMIGEDEFVRCWGNEGADDHPLKARMLSAADGRMCAITEGDELVSEGGEWVCWGEDALAHMPDVTAASPWAEVKWESVRTTQDYTCGRGNSGASYTCVGGDGSDPFALIAGTHTIWDGAANNYIACVLTQEDQLLCNPEVDAPLIGGMEYEALAISPYAHWGCALQRGLTNLGDNDHVVRCTGDDVPIGWEDE
jgi:hypothetical protein